mgnify:CR=1 FL=1
MFSFRIIAEDFEGFENYIFDCKVLWVVGRVRVNGILSVSWFCEVCSAVSRSIS